jgi:hypothetical protein
MRYYPVPDTQYSSWIIDLGQLNDFLEITSIMRELKILKYVYCFSYNGTIIKYGISADHSYTWGERIYRQAGHLQGWLRRLQGSSGSDMRIIDSDFYEMHNQHLNRTGMIIKIINMNSAPNPHLSDNAWPCRRLERDLISEHALTHGKPPIGNKNDESWMDRKGFVSSKTWNQFFEEVAQC